MQTPSLKAFASITRELAAAWYHLFFSGAAWYHLDVACKRFPLQSLITFAQPEENFAGKHHQQFNIDFEFLTTSPSGGSVLSEEANSSQAASLLTDSESPFTRTPPGLLKEAASVYLSPDPPAPPSRRLAAAAASPL
jgi:hypothetical protein